MHTFIKRNLFVYSEILIEIMWATSHWVILWLISKCEWTWGGPSTLVQPRLAWNTSDAWPDTRSYTVDVRPRHPVWPFLIAEKEAAEVTRHGYAKWTTLVIPLRGR